MSANGLNGERIGLRVKELCRLLIVTNQLFGHFGMSIMLRKLKRVLRWLGKCFVLYFDEKGPQILWDLRDEDPLPQRPSAGNNLKFCDVFGRRSFTHRSFEMECILLASGAFIGTTFYHIDIKNSDR